MALVEDFIAVLKNRGATFNPPASSGLLSHLHAHLQAPVPRLMRELYSRANGMPDMDVDEDLLSLWSIERILEDPDGLLELDGARHVAFADGMLNAWFLRLKMGATGTSVVNDLDPATLHWLSFGDFLAGYVASPSDVAIGAGVG